MQGSAPTEECALCGTVATLRWSHIVPRWTYRRVIQTAGPGNPKIVNVSEDAAVFGGDQFAEYMLCADCEQRFGLWENYVAGIALQRDDSFPALQQAKPIPGLDIENWKVVDLSALQTETIARFAASVVWRASISTTFPKVSLGSHEAAFSAYLLDDTEPVPDSMRMLLHLIDDQTRPRVDHVVTAPASSREGNYHVHHFAMFGMWFRVMVGGVIPADFNLVCLPRSKRGVITDASHLRSLVFDTASKATPKGKLASRSKK